jgi:hypothetical protein
MVKTITISLCFASLPTGTIIIARSPKMIGSPRAGSDRTTNFHPAGATRRIAARSFGMENE